MFFDGQVTHPKLLHLAVQHMMFKMSTKKIQTVKEVQTVTEIQAVQIMQIIGSVEPNFNKRSLAADNTLESP